jgi:hypothetical protein
MVGTTAGRVARMVVADSLSHPDLADAFHGLVAQRRAHSRRIIENAVTRGELAADADAEVLTDMLSGPVFYRLLVSGDPIDDEFLDSLVERVVQAGAR